jgi:hypothetical protein
MKIPPCHPIEMEHPKFNNQGAFRHKALTPDPSAKGMLRDPKNGRGE